MKVRRLIEALPVEQRETVDLAYYHGMTCREIATRLREPLGIIKTHLRVGLFRLYEQLSSDANDLDELRG